MYEPQLFKKMLINNLKKQLVSQYQHNESTCVCQECSCGLCKCETSQKSELPHLLKSSYKQDFRAKVADPVKPLICSPYKEKNERFRSISTYNSYYQPHQIQKRTQTESKYRSIDIPFDDKSCYQEQYVPLKIEQSILFKPIEVPRYNTLPIAQRTSYKHSYKEYEVSKNDFDRPQSQLRNKSPNIFLKTSYQHFFDAKRALSTQKGEKKDDTPFLPSYMPNAKGHRGSFKTNYQNDYRTKSIPKCRARTLMENYL